MEDVDERFAELGRLEPGLLELERDVRAVHDDGQAAFFCSNHVWLPLSARLRQLVGVGRPGWGTHERGDPLYDSGAFEAAYLHLTRLMPACRDCGCRRFRALQEELEAAGSGGPAE